MTGVMQPQEVESSGPERGRVRLAILVNSLAGGGAEKVALTLFTEYVRLGQDVVLICLERNDVYPAPKGKVVYLSQQTGAREGSSTKLFWLLLSAFRLKQYIADNEINLVQSHIYRSNYVNVLARKLGARHHVQIVNHGIASRYKDQGLLGFINLRLIRWLYPNADQLVCPSEGMLNDLRSLNAAPQMTRVIGNPFDVEFILKRSKEPVLDSEFQFRPGARYLITVGRLERVKRFDDVIRALYHLSSSHSDLELLVLGSGPEEPALHTLVAEFGLSAKVHFLGHVSNPFKFISRVEILVSASQYEGFSNVIAEALICGAVVVSADCPSGPREILAPHTHGTPSLSAGEAEYSEYGVLVPVEDVSAMARAVDCLLRSPVLSKTYASRGIVRGRCFSAPVIARNYLLFVDTAT